MPRKSDTPAARPTPESTPEVEDVQPLDRTEFLALLRSSEDTARAELGSAYQYLNFYVGLIAAVLAGTLAGYLQLEAGELEGLALLSGSAAAILLGAIGYESVAVFYRRFSEAWVAQLNLLGMLGLLEEPTAIKVQFPSQRGGGPFPQPLNPELAKMFRETKTGEALANEIVRHSPTLRYARWTFYAYAITALSLAAAVIVRTF